MLAGSHAAVPALLAALAAACAPPAPMTSSEVPVPGRVETFETTMQALGGRSRTVRVYLPPGYDRSTTRYPVLYLQDGQSLFTAGAYGDWRVDETVDALVARGESEGIIVVGIDNGVRRWDEYGPWVNAGMRAWVDSAWTRPSEGGEGAAYVAFLADELKPEIDRRYRTRPGREHTAIGGSSMGGLISLHAGLTRPEVFSRVLAMSTAVWFAEDGGAWLSGNRLLAEIRARARPDVRYYLDVGTDEHSRDTNPDVRDREGRPLTYPRAYLEGSHAAVRALLDAGVPAAHVRHVVEPGAPHHEGAWARRLAPALRWLFAE